MPKDCPKRLEVIGPKIILLMKSPFTCKEMCPYKKGTYLDFSESLYLFDEVFSVFNRDIW